MKKRSWTEQQLKEAVKVSRSIRQILSRLGLKEAGGNYFQIRKYLNFYKIDYSHFTGPGWSKGMKGIGKPRMTLEEILVSNSNFQSYKLKNRLFIAGLKFPKCEKCGWAEKSADGRIPLELDHVNGDAHDNRLENLQVICPNCHSLQSTHRGRNIKKRILNS